MDSSNLSDLLRMGGSLASVRLFADFAELPDVSDIPDPYGGDPADFDHVLDLLETAAPVVAKRLGQLVETVPE
jgi:protein-tyrosine-phosphatase